MIRSDSSPTSAATRRRPGSLVSSRTCASSGWTANRSRSSSQISGSGPNRGPRSFPSGRTSRCERMTIRPRLYAVLLGVFAAVAIALAAVGVFSVVAYAVAQRTREMGIRLALGARRSTILLLVLRQSTLLTGLGVVIGLLGASALAGYLEGMLFGVTPHAPETFASVGAGFLVVATGAALLPAFRATRIDPAVALRSE